MVLNTFLVDLMCVLTVGSVVCEFVCGECLQHHCTCKSLVKQKSYVQAPHYSAVIYNQQKTLAAEGNF